MESKTHEVVGIRPCFLYQQGFRCIEVPLNSPNAIESIRLWSTHCQPIVCIWAGDSDDDRAVEQVHAVGGRLIVMPYADVVIVKTR